MGQVNGRDTKAVGMSSGLFRDDAKALDLRPYQLDAIEQVREHIRNGKKNIILCAPTGSGKTVIGSHLINEADRKLKRSAFVVDRTTLINQTSETFDTYGIDHGVVQADHPRARPWQRVQLCSAQTVARRKWPEADLLVIDEAHTVMKVVTDRITPRNTITIGLTATPFTKGLGKLYDALVNVTTTAKLIEDGFLSPYRIFAAVEPNMDGVKVVAGEWVDTEASKRALEVVGDVVAEYVKHGEERKFICSACDVAHAEEMARQFNAAGIRAEAYSYRTPDDLRAEMVTEFRKANSTIRGLISPVALTKGFDVPDVSCIIMARPLRKSLAEHIQFFGRGLRVHHSKENCIVLDHSGNSARFWHEWNDFFETGCLELDDGKPKPKPKKKDGEEVEFIKCGNCKHLYKPMPRCPACGHERPRQQTVQHVAGTLKELVASGDRKRLTADVWPQIVGYARDLRGDAGGAMAFAIFIKMTGQKPARQFADTPSAPLSREVANWIKADRIRYIKGKQAAERRAQAEVPA